MKKAINPKTGMAINSSFIKVLTYGLTPVEFTNLSNQILNDYQVEKCDDNFTDLIGAPCTAIVLNPSGLDPAQVDILNQCYSNEERVLFLVTQNPSSLFTFITHDINLKVSKSVKMIKVARLLQILAQPGITNCFGLSLNDNFIMLDLETTGINPTSDEIISISALRMANFKVVDRFESLIKPSVPSSPFIAQLTGITNDNLDFAPSRAQVIEKFLEWSQEDPLVLSLAIHDMSFLNSVVSQNDQLLDNYGTIDILSLASKLYANRLFGSPRTLKEITKLLIGEEYVGINDVDTIANLFIFLANKLCDDFEFCELDKISKLYD